jgi:cell division protein FtsI (penicillin-binding protein 3)
VLSVDRSVQYTVEQALLERVAAVEARGATAIVMSTKTGEIIAMASVRRDDETGKIEVTSGNFAAVDAYEPGSVVKVATLAAALNEGTVTPDTGFTVPGAKQYSKGDVPLHDAEPHGEEWWTVRDILTRSSNIGTIESMLTMGSSLRETKEKEYTYLRAFGLGAKSPLDFPGESVGILKDWKKWEGTEQYTVAYGQGLASTSIQLVSAINVLANGGTYVAPKLVRSTIDSSGAVTDTPPSATHRVVSPAVAHEMNLMMRDVVCSESGTGNGAQVDGVTIAGKTGTGLKAQPGGGYLDKDGNRTYYASFVGFFPAEDPQATVLVSIDEPNGNEITRFGGTAAAPVFAQIAPSIMHEMGFTPPTTGGGCPGG